MSRLAIHEHAPEGYRTVAALDRYVREHLDRVVLDLVKLRASQINGCAYCIAMHAADLEAAGVPTAKIHALPAWRETAYFSPAERAALALTEQVTRIDGGVDDATWAEAAGTFSERELADLVLAIGLMNLWNRIGVSTHLSPPPLRA